MDYVLRRIRISEQVISTGGPEVISTSSLMVLAGCGNITSYLMCIVLRIEYYYDESGFGYKYILGKDEWVCMWWGRGAG